jgi:hypothetical protein
MIKKRSHSVESFARIESFMVRVTMPSAQNNTLAKDRLISARVSDSPVERSRFGLVKIRILVLPWWTD